jgi:two-component system phosphate regulon response regulator PhoB
MTTILVAVEDASLFGLLEYKLSKEGFNVVGVPDGVAAQAKLAEASFDVLLLDLMIPKVDGFQILRGMIENPETRPLATIILSARSEEEDVLRAFDLGAVDYIVKPFSLNVLVARINIALNFKSPVGLSAELTPKATAASPAAEPAAAPVASAPFSIDALVGKMEQVQEIKAGTPV